jgi:hypothetical protein
LSGARCLSVHGQPYRGNLDRKRGPQVTIRLLIGDRYAKQGRWPVWPLVRCLSCNFTLGFVITGAFGGGVLALLKLPWDPVLPNGFSILLAWSFVALMGCLHNAVPDERRTWSQLGLAFAVLYAAMVSIVYYVIITVVTPLTLQGQAARVDLLTFNANGSFMQALDGLGYGFMSLSTLFASFVFQGNGINRLVKVSFIANGVLVLPILLVYAPLAVPNPYRTIVQVPAAFWVLTAPMSGISMAVYFKRQFVDHRA